MGWKYNHSGVVIGLMLCTLTCGFNSQFAQAKSSSVIDGWDVEGMHGEIEVSGELIESPCYLSMESEEQTVNMGTIPRYRLQKIGDRAPEIAVHIQLKDCGMVSNHVQDDEHDETLYSLPDQQVAFMTINGNESESHLHLLHVKGEAKGVALRLEDSKHRQLFVGEHSRGQIMSQGNTDMVLYAMLERTDKPLKEGRFNVLMNFTLGYH
ncbi:hypothetical protein XK97_14345 [Obesumbacterium proteus]|uniref:fimbrial protein n=1 Tax=Obesumbacterium proteus TaxID=82983 RepID=UPI000621FB71|nr:fimbrial protein [Obesumbacterium proteus]KKI44162.1 hypothetical protein XK97_14345 [Obesumbacterium proteus]TBL53660.1 type 1 fimbrial protein [Obesumbacterium proteus]